MDFVYLNRDGENEELRYSIRSVYHFYPNANVWVVGGKPEWYIGNFIKVQKNNLITKYQQQILNLSQVYHSNDIGPNPIIMNDDFFFVKKVDKFVPMVTGPLSDRVREYMNNEVLNKYVRELNKMNKILQKNKAVPLDYELHTPMQIKTDNLKDIIECDKVMWRSNYGNKFIKDENTLIAKDVKFYLSTEMSFKSYDPIKGNSPFFSTEDKSFPYIRDRILSKMFPNPCKDEVQYYSDDYEIIV
jgi:hypothetical protein